MLAQIDWTARIYNYCERGGSATFWAEPLNAWSNLAFWVAAMLFGRWLISAGRQGLFNTAPRGLKRDLWLLNALLFGIGAGSFCFHTFAQRWAGMLDVGFIVLWVYWYLWVTARRVMRWPAVGVGIALVLHLASAFGLIMLTHWFLLSYLPTLLVAYALALHARRDKLNGERWLWGSACVFTLSMVMAGLDKPLCEWVPVGTHFVWHLLNATALFCGSIGLAKNLLPGGVRAERA